MDIRTRIWNYIKLLRKDDYDRLEEYVLSKYPIHSIEGYVNWLNIDDLEDFFYEMLDVVGITPDKIWEHIENLNEDEYGALLLKTYYDLINEFYNDYVYDLDEEGLLDELYQIKDVIEYRETLERNRKLKVQTEVFNKFSDYFELLIWDNDSCEYVEWDEEVTPIKLEKRNIL